MREHPGKEKDPYEEYDKFWDELDKAEEIRADEDYFKEKRRSLDIKKTEQSENSDWKNKQINHSYMLLAFFIMIGGGPFLLFIILSRSNHRFPNISFVIFFVVMGLIINIILKSLKNKK